MRAGAVVLGLSAVAVVAAESLVSVKNAETLIAPDPISSFSESASVISEVSSALSESSSESSAMSSAQSALSPQTSQSAQSTSASSEIRIEPPILSESSESEPVQTDIFSEETSENSLPSESVDLPTYSEQTYSVPSVSSVQEISSIFSGVEIIITSNPISSSTSEPKESSIVESTSEPPVTSTTEQSNQSEQSSSVTSPVESSVPLDPPEQSTDISSSEPDTEVLSMVNINTASSEELQTLNGIGSDKAEAIIAYRERYGDFVSIYDIRRVDGIGDSVFEGIRSFITV